MESYYSFNSIQDFFQLFLNLWQGTNPSLWSRKKRSLHAKSNKWRRPISNQHNTGIYGLGASRRERIQKVFSPSLSSKSRRRKRLKRSLSGASDGLLGDNTNTVSSYHTSTSGYSGSGSGDYGTLVVVREITPAVRETTVVVREIIIMVVGRKIMLAMALGHISKIIKKSWPTMSKTNGIKECLNFKKNFKKIQGT